MTTLAGLTATLGPDLEPRAAAADLDIPVSGVHVSELIDPTAYLTGGELLLTTGIPLHGRLQRCRSYAARLSRIGVSGLGFGLGPVFDEVPPSLVRACETVGLPLFAIPGPTPFLTVSRAYWDSLASAGRAEVTASLGAHRDLIRALRQRDPAGAIVKVLAGAIGGWAARLDQTGTVTDVWPRSQRSAAAALTTEIGWLRQAGAHASASFPVDDSDVVVQPLARGQRVDGFLATAAPHPMRVADRQLALAASALLTLPADRRQEVAARRRAERSCVALLVMSGHVDAARDLASELGDEPPPAVVRLIAAAGPAGPSAVDAVGAVDGGGGSGDPTTWSARTPEALWILGSAAAVDSVLGELRPAGAQARPDRATMRVAVSPPFPIAEAARQRVALQSVLEQLAPGGFSEPAGGTDAGRARRQLAALAGYRRSDLIAAVTAYLAERGHWDRAAERAGVHRNTMRQRIARAGAVADVALDDPDQAAHLWLALRERGAGRPTTGIRHAPNPAPDIADRVSGPS